MYACTIHPVKTPLHRETLARGLVVARLRVDCRHGWNLASGNDTKLGTNQEGVSLDTGTVVNRRGAFTAAVIDCV